MITRYLFDYLPSDLSGEFQRWCYRKTDSPTLHTHAFHELFWIERGEGRQLINGQWRALTPGQVVLIRPEDVHGFTALEADGLDLANFAFRSEIWTRIRDRFFPGGRAFFDEPDPARREHFLGPVAISAVRAITTQLLRTRLDLLVTEAALLAIIGVLHQEREHPTPTCPDWLSQACEQFQTSGQFRFGTRRLAELAGCSPEHLARSARRFLGRTPSDLVNEARMIFAAQQLRATSRTILEIVGDCGLENVGHFYALFRQHYGLSPARYRREALQTVATPPRAFSKSME